MMIATVIEVTKFASLDHFSCCCAACRLVLIPRYIECTLRSELPLTSALVVAAQLSRGDWRSALSAILIPRRISIANLEEKRRVGFVARHLCGIVRRRSGR